MPMATAVPFSPSAEVAQAGLGDFKNVSYISLQVASPSNINTVPLGATQNGVPSDAPYLSIIEQPKNKWRYRYQSEKGSHGPLQGCSTTASGKTFPTVKVMNCPGNVDVYVRASLWTSDEVPQRHVHKLYGSPCSTDGSCTVKLKKDRTAVFQDITILFVAKKDVPKILLERIQKEENCNMELGQLKKLAEERAKAMNLNSVRICFEAICFNHDKTECVSLCSPVFSNPVANQRSTKDGDLKICRISACKGVAAGGDEVFLLCCKVDKKDIQVRFYEPSSSWEGFGKFTEADVHQQCAIVFRTPPYQRHDITDPVEVLLQLQRKNGDASDPVTFIYIPNDPDDQRLSKKRKKNCLYQELETEDDINRNFRAQNISGNFGAQASTPVLQDQNSPIGAESMNGSSQGSACSSAGCSDEQLGADFSHLTQIGSFDDMFGPDLFNTETADLVSVLLNSHEDPLLSQVNVPLPNWNLPPVDSTYPSGNPFYKTDAVVVSIEVPEDAEKAAGEESSAQKDVPVKAEEVEEAFRKLAISGRSAEVSENSSSCSGESNQQTLVKEEAVQDEWNTSTTLHKREQFQTRTVSDSSLKKFWHSLCVALRKQNPFDFLRNIPQLIGYSDEDQNTLLHLAVSLEPPCEFIIESLLKTAEEVCCPIVNFANKDHKTPLHIAVKAKKPSAVNLLLKYGADPTLTDRQGFSSYHWAIYVKSQECLIELLQHVNYTLPDKTSCLDSTDYYGLTPLHYAVRGELIECITLLCVHGADVNIRSKKDGRTPLHYAALQSSEVARILLSKKTIDVNAQDYGGNTPLHLACSSKNSEVVRILMSHGADPWICNCEPSSFTPFDFAEGNEEVKRLLMSSCNFKEQHDMNFREATSCASSRSKVPSPSNSAYKLKDSDRSLQLKYKSNASRNSSCSAKDQGDSGYISGDLSLLNDDDLLQKLSRLLDPPSDSWKNLMMCTIMDEDFEKNIHKLTSSPTKAILKTFMNNGGTTETLLTAFEAAELHEAQDILIQHISQESK